MKLWTKIHFECETSTYKCLEMVLDSAADHNHIAMIIKHNLLKLVDRSWFFCIAFKMEKKSELAGL